MTRNPEQIAAERYPAGFGSPGRSGDPRAAFLAGFTVAVEECIAVLQKESDARPVTQAESHDLPGITYPVREQHGKGLDMAIGLLRALAAPADAGKGG